MTTPDNNGPADPAARPVRPIRKVERDAVILLVEDNVIFALDAEDMLRRLGYGIVLPHQAVASALRAIDEGRVDFAILDIRLAEETSFPVAVRLKAAGIDFVFACEEDDSDLLPEEFLGAAVLAKPYTMENLRLALAG